MTTDPTSDASASAALDGSQSQHPTDRLEHAADRVAHSTKGDKVDPAANAYFGKVIAEEAFLKHENIGVVMKRHGLDPVGTPGLRAAVSEHLAGLQNAKPGDDGFESSIPDAPDLDAGAIRDLRAGRRTVGEAMRAAKALPDVSGIGQGESVGRGGFTPTQMNARRAHAVQVMTGGTRAPHADESAIAAIVATEPNHDAALAKVRKAMSSRNWGNKNYRDAVKANLAAIYGKATTMSTTYAAPPIDMMGTHVYLSAPAILEPAVTLGQGYPAEFNGEQIIYRWVDSAVSGNWRHPRTGQHVPIDAKRINGWVKNVKTALSRGVDLPAVKDHKETADASLGAIFDAREKGGRLQTLVGFYGEDAFKIGKRNKVSVGIDPNFKDSHGNVYGESIRHLAFTPVPVIHGQQGFIAASRGEPTEAIYLSLAPEGVDMIDPALMSRVAQHLGDDTADDANEALRLALDKLDAAHTQLSAAAPTVSDREQKANARALGYQLDAALNAGRLSKWQRDELQTFVAAPLMLSAAEDGGAADVDRLLSIIAGGPGLRGDEQTGIQTTELSRPVPDAPATPDVDAEVKATLAMTSLGQRALAAK